MIKYSNTLIELNRTTGSDRLAALREELTEEAMKRKIAHTKAALLKWGVLEKFLEHPELVLLKKVSLQINQPIHSLFSIVYQLPKSVENYHTINHKKYLYLPKTNKFYQNSKIYIHLLHIHIQT